jgi:hypothetical protein
VQIASKCIKKFSTSLAIKRCKSKQQLDFISPQLKWPYSREITTTNAGNDVVKQEPLHTAGGNAN